MLSSDELYTNECYKYRTQRNFSGYLESKREASNKYEWKPLELFVVHTAILANGVIREKSVSILPWTRMLWTTRSG